MFAQAVGIINVSLSRDCDRFWKNWLSASKAVIQPEIKQTHLSFLQVREGVGEANEEGFPVFFATLLLPLSYSKLWVLACTEGWEHAWDVRRPQSTVSGPGCVHAARCTVMGDKRDWDATLTGLTQFIWKFSGENMSNKDKNGDSKEQTWISVRDKTEF